MEVNAESSTVGLLTKLAFWRILKGKKAKILYFRRPKNKVERKETPYLLREFILPYFKSREQLKFFCQATFFSANYFLFLGLSKLLFEYIC